MDALSISTGRRIGTKQPKAGRISRDQEPKLHQSTTSPNADQITYWNTRAGETWAAMQKRIDAQVGPLGLRGIEQLALSEGESVLDVGCGCGATTFELARRVGAPGQVTAVDISKPMLDVARRAADEAEHCTRGGPLARLLAENPEAVAPVKETLRSTLRDYENHGAVKMDAGVWIVSARTP